MLLLILVIKVSNKPTLPGIITSQYHVKVMIAYTIHMFMHL